MLSVNNDLFLAITIAEMLPPKHHTLAKVCVCVLLVFVLVSYLLSLLQS